MVATGVAIVIKFVLCLYSLFAMKKVAFTQANSVCYSFHGEDIIESSETFIVSSLWSYKQTHAMVLRPKNVIRILLIISGDIETCPGPIVKCNCCGKGIREDTAVCSRCNLSYHLRCFKSNETETECFLVCQST